MRTPAAAKTMTQLWGEQIVLSLLLVLLGGMSLDGGYLGRVILAGIVATWAALAALLVLRRLRRRPLLGPRLRRVFQFTPVVGICAGFVLGSLLLALLASMGVRRPW